MAAASDHQDQPDEASRSSLGTGSAPVGFFQFINSSMSTGHSSWYQSDTTMRYSSSHVTLSERVTLSWIITAAHQYTQK